MSVGRTVQAARRSTQALSSIVVTTVMLAACAASMAQISPGPLARPHQSLDGAANCMKCHGGGGETALRERCLGCHEELALLATQKKGLHATKNWDNCAKCHEEHAGRNRALIRFEGGRADLFDHQQTGWPLQGKHAALKCEECHTPRRQVAEVAELARRRERRLVFIGLVPDCAACHDDVHSGTLGRDCGSCHHAAAWKPAPRFQHAKTAFPLLGKHADTPCVKCHRPAPASAPVAHTGARAVQLFKPLRHEQCSDCHADAHAGRLGPDCARCHDAASFRRQAGGDFDHDRTRYPLRGLHRLVKCEACHRRTGARVASQIGAEPVDSSLRPPHARCGDCHSDAHGGQLKRRPDGGECATCHKVEGWKPSAFTVADHAKLSFALAGRHAEIPCAGCHAPGALGLRPGLRADALGAARVALNTVDPSCASCHVDPHDGRFAPGGARAKNGDCLACHDLRAFRPSTVNAEIHRSFEVPIDGAHRSLRCEKCHKELRPTALKTTLRSGAAEVFLPFTDAGKKCAGCHESPHGDQFAARADGGACESCHADNFFRPAARFEHDRDSRFPLMRAHALTPCSHCHDTKPTASGRSAVVYRPVSLNCRECHREKLASRQAADGRRSKRPSPEPAAASKPNR